MKTVRKATVVNIKAPSEFDVYIGRSGNGYDGYFGNPFKLATRSATIEAFRRYFLDRVDRDLVYRARVMALAGKRLGCFCYPLPCHGNVIADWVNERAV